MSSTLLYHTRATSEMVSMIAEARSPELCGVLDASVQILNKLLDRAVEDVYRGLPGLERQRHHINGRRVHRRGRAKVNGKKALRASRMAVEPRISVEPKDTPPVPDTDYWEPSSALSVSRCKRLLLEILRRAAHDWILYRQHHKMGLRELAEDAYIWLFEEGEGHPYWEARKGSSESSMTSFLAICEILDFDPDDVRSRVKKMDIRTIISSGRPAETRRQRPQTQEQLTECGVTIAVDVDSDGGEEDEYETKYESYGSVSTPSSLTPIEFFLTYDG